MLITKSDKNFSSGINSTSKTNKLSYEHIGPILELGYCWSQENEQEFIKLVDWIAHKDPRHKLKVPQLFFDEMITCQINLVKKDCKDKILVNCDTDRLEHILDYLIENKFVVDTTSVKEKQIETQKHQQKNMISCYIRIIDFFINVPQYYRNRNFETGQVETNLDQTITLHQQRLPLLKQLLQKSTNNCDKNINETQMKQHNMLAKLKQLLHKYEQFCTYSMLQSGKQSIVDHFQTWKTTRDCTGFTVDTNRSTLELFKEILLDTF